MVKVHGQPCEVHGLDHVLTDHGLRPWSVSPWSLTMMPFNKTWISMDIHGPVPLDIHGHPWKSMVKINFIRLGVLVCTPRIMNMGAKCSNIYVFTVWPRESK